MSLGNIARRVLGRHFPRVGRAYRSLFVDLNKVAFSISPHIPMGAVIVDVGGGDGEPLNPLLSLRPDVTVKLIDPSSSVGQLIAPDFIQRVQLHPGMSMEDFSRRLGHRPEVILISDVVHHVPAEARRAFFMQLRTLAGGADDQVRIIIKDVEPGHLRSTLGLLADRYISGDRATSLVGRAAMCALVASAFGAAVTLVESDLMRVDSPNYALVFTYGGRGQAG